ncbi:MAG: acetyl-CoA carboxylase biotin carboxylase subunit [Candidatus Dadabacteria bacterium]|nr:acetyl-CoA carboxylase biotin carboxylase subunit [Candidatus Dadabacteria bacterium]NIS07552.1 acetyl-CoA carboxylase biotin carboxylase subunit [Candidatus Dadabacteria bacterium]NIY21167.1 acetyl-CoA carboxylase biotin carboxylase subunit [Candidatus Dadabacteria bacterium]
MFNKILIANRGEIAVRIIRACKELGIATVAVYSDADRKSLHVILADEAYHIGPPAPNQSYLVKEKIIEVAKKSGAEAIHPGFGFLSENDSFADLCEKEGIVFIGPSSEAIKLMGDKITARKIAQDAKVPLVPGSDGAVTDVQAGRIADKIGYPVMIKASAGGGGKGMRLVRDKEDFESSLRMARSEARGAFGDDSVYVERFVENPRHIEIQIIADSHGNVLHLFERECSIQRRHQKVIEEAPSGFISAKTRKKMGEVAVRIAKAVNYRGAGTVEFIMDQKQNFYFLEMNTRIQVEHPVTEMITGIDIVKWMVRIAAGQKLPYKQSGIHMKGHALECRVYAEDPEMNFIPSPGLLEYVKAPSGPGIRDDSCIYSGYEVTSYYDPMLSKLVVWGEDREDAVNKMLSALKEYIVLGVKTNIGFLIRVMRDENFRKVNFDTGFIDKYPELLKPTTEELDLPLIAAALAVETMEQQEGAGTSSKPDSKWKSLARQMGVSRNYIL